MSETLRERFEKYADLAIRVGLNLQQGQRLVIRAPVEAVELTRVLTAKAYDLGSPFVDVVYSDEELELIRFQHAPRDSFEEYPTWRVKGHIERAEQGAAFLSISGNNPDLLKDQDTDLVALTRKVGAEQSKPFTREFISTMKVSWCVISAAVAPWAARVFPDVPADQQVGKLWDAIFEMCRLDEADPTAAWQEHIEALERRRAYLNDKAYAALKYTAPGTDLTLGLPEGHIWKGGVDTNAKGTMFVPNLPTEEVFTMPHCQRTNGMVSSTKPLNYGGTLIDNFSLTFQDGRIVGVEAETGRDVLKKLVETDDGAARLGEVALVPHSSPISKFGKLFYNTLFDENASNHVALGQAYNVCVEDGENMAEADFAESGGNTSVTHVDFMIGSEEMDIDGVMADGSTEAVMRQGEWAFEA
jgi:aminopeptidase